MCPECFAVEPERLFYKQDTEEIIGCSDCAEYASRTLIRDIDQYQRLIEANPVEEEELD